MKTLYFEGAGWDYQPTEKSNVGNYRIRTAFINNDGQSIYIELGGHEFSDKKTSCWKSHVDHVFYTPTNEKEKEYLRSKNDIKGYTKAEIVKWVNRNFNCSFDDMEVLDDMEGYRVHGDNRTYNLMDDHIVNRERTLARKKAYEEIDMYYRQKLNEKYSKISMLKMDDTSITIRCYASKEALSRAGLTEADREKTIIVNY